MAPQDVTVTIYRGLNTLPHFSPEIDGENSPAAVNELRELITKADGLIICTPEYAFGVPGVLKNALDWTVSSGEFTKKPVAVISASPMYEGGKHAHASLLLTLKALDADIRENAKLTIPAVYKKLNAEGEIIDSSTRDSLRSVLMTLVEGIESRRSLSANVE